MNIDIIKTIEYDKENDAVKIIDQTLLPTEYKILSLTNYLEMGDAIKRLAVRGAPLIGISAAYGVYLGIKDIDDKSKLDAEITKVIDYLKTTRPTAVNLFWALDEMKKTYDANKEKSLSEIKQVILEKAQEIYDDDLERSRKIGEYGDELIKENATLITICNAGGLATSGLGTALAPMYVAKSKNKNIKVYSLETRPLLQGSRLTAWELMKNGVDVTTICDNTAAFTMKKNPIDLIITGADRIAINGDTANKIGTLMLAILAKEFGIPFYVAAPLSTFDLKLKSGDEIPIEERSSIEVTNGFGKQTAPENVKVFSPAFDVTSNELITGIITEKGIIKKPYQQEITKLF